MVYGDYWSRTFPGNEDSGAELHRITGGLSMACSGYCALEHPGVICRHAMGNGVLCTSVSADGGIKAFGKSYWKYWWMNLILNG